MRSGFKTYICVFAVSASAFSFYCGDAGSKRIEGFSNPESVACDGKNFFVSNLGTEQEPTQKDGDGFISKVHSDGKTIELQYIKGLDAPKGMTVIGKTLYVADIDKVKGFDLLTGNQTFVADLETQRVTFLNDVCEGESGKLLVSATDIGVVFEIDLKTAKFSELKFSEPITGPNGIQYDAKTKTLYIATLAEKGKVLKAEKKNAGFIVSAVISEAGNYDGIFFSGTAVVVSDWTSGTLKKTDLQTMKTETVKFTDPAMFSGPADFYYDKNSKCFWVPEMQAGVLWKINYAL